MEDLTFTIKRDKYTYCGTISHMKKRPSNSISIYFKEWTSRYFSFSANKLALPANVQEGSYVKIKFLEIITKDLSFFRITSIKLKKKKSKDIETSPSVKCNNCGNLCELSNFQRCEGFYTEFGCNTCDAENISKTGHRCYRQTTRCKKCGNVRQI